MASARLELVRRRPYLAAALWAMAPRETPGIGTMAVDRQWRLYYDPVTIGSWTQPELVGVLYHEVCHLLRDHAGRAPGHSHRAWNAAADAEINDDILCEGFELPGTPVTPQLLERPTNLFAEEYFAGLPVATTILLRCGSGVTSQIEPWDLPLAGGVAPLVEGRLIRGQVALAIARSKCGGGVPAHWERWADDVTGKPLDWRTLLRREIQHALTIAPGATDYTYQRRSRRSAPGGRVIFPALISRSPEVAVIADTSGSIGNADLTQFAAEIDGIIGAIGVRSCVPVVAVDEQVQAVTTASSARRVKFAGGGGTDLRVGFEAVAKMRPRPAALVVLTDGYTPWPEQPLAGTRTIVALTTCAEWTPPWARVVHINGGTD